MIHLAPYQGEESVITPLHATTPELRAASDAVAALFAGYRDYFASPNDSDARTRCNELHAQARRCLSEPKVTALIKTRIDRLRQDPDTSISPLVGLRSLGDHIDLTRQDSALDERGLSMGLGVQDAEFATFVVAARRGLRRINNSQSRQRIHYVEVLTSLLDLAHDRFEKAYVERERREKFGRNRKGRSKAFARRRSEDRETICGCLYAVGIIIVDADYEGLFHVSYALGSGVSFECAPDASLVGAS